MGTDPILRGDYSKAGLDYSVEQDWSAYTPAEHALYRRLFERQSKLVPRYACNEWIDAIAGLDSAREIPRFDKVSRQLKAKTGWEIVAVPGLIQTASGIRAYGAGLLSSGGELAYCVDDPRPRRLAFDLERIMRTEYQIDRYQETYFYIDSFAHLMRETAPDFTPIYARIRSTLS